MKSSNLQNDESSATEQMQLIFSQQRSNFDAEPYPDLESRRTKLFKLKKQIIRYQDVIAAAINTDFSSRSIDESKLLDLLGSVLEAEHAIRHLRRWMRPSKRSTELLFLSNRLRVQYQPKGVVGVVVPWNFPVYLALGPLVAALAAGNRVMIKLPEVTPATNAVVKRMLGEIFKEDEVAVFGEEITDPAHFTSLPFNHIVFTGSPAIGRVVMRAAAENLTPVTLELGGKSPALVSRHYPLADAAKRVLHGKATNCGQICVAPDYALVPKEKIDEFVEECKSNFAAMYGNNISNNTNYTSIVNDRHLKRLQEILEDAKQNGAQIIACGEYNPEQDARRMPVHIVLNCTPQMRIMKEELFGPILPIVAYDTLDDAINFIKAGERPLALYCFTHDANERDYILKNTHSGGVTINDWGWHVVNHDAPFGGIGNSGMGTYHGEEGFRELSHAKTVFIRHRFFPTQLFYPPYGTWVQKLALRFFLKQGDPNLK
ncbi:MULTISPECIES: coniferyl aldehyde dehydrogenase [unclassified Acinetobacter]|uniref:coniferyl aldehyde dehydrogenase n=1 Tax=unclassified Acinetobacter TaxID=196816 RepID=UPI0024493A95|nr:MULTISPECIES: coniferyl aldehyde dehydrogenase [unclassified Acinetobacter]MDH0030651.1 coniferyl aldehyde dehydrogenase [Acinetobacter sp. GD04021]MDH0886238.1 coniferyl aldehyde dehydrogenase [Acinetobacter sp. GD03873]MDH1081787.1 coniferyl aldehyde dehydrogenase [Acinetobacter sp. GD03983]MDH2189715.1 coniferyl aldehyde dehydrogenase [Acinetobacter sp. GD03645]MDH2202707.1 coniferyl aldehyde dehydrogenase [Acinetobacter sp. GD03647]